MAIILFFLKKQNRQYVQVKLTRKSEHDKMMDHVYTQDGDEYSLIKTRYIDHSNSGHFLVKKARTWTSVTSTKCPTNESDIPNERWETWLRYEDAGAKGGITQRKGRPIS